MYPNPNIHVLSECSKFYLVWIYRIPWRLLLPTGPPPHGLSPDTPDEPSGTSHPFEDTALPDGSADMPTHSVEQVSLAAVETPEEEKPVDTTKRRSNAHRTMLSRSPKAARDQKTKDKAAEAFQPDAHVLNKRTRAERKKNMDAAIIANITAEDLWIAEQGQKVNVTSVSSIDSDTIDPGDTFAELALAGLANEIAREVPNEILDSIEAEATHGRKHHHGQKNKELPMINAYVGVCRGHKDTRTAWTLGNAHTKAEQQCHGEPRLMCLDTEDNHDNGGNTKANVVMPGRARINGPRHRGQPRQRRQHQGQVSNAWASQGQWASTSRTTTTTATTARQQCLDERGSMGLDIKDNHDNGENYQQVECAIILT
jgi:hypothetical protein